MKEQLSNPKDQKGSSNVMPKRENGDVRSGFGPSKDEPHNDTSHQNVEASSSFDFNKIPVFPSSKPNADLPRNLQNKLEAAFGEDFSKVAIQKNSQEASKLNALAYTQGEKMHFAPGEYSPNSEKGKNLIGHEFTHIVQQRNKVVSPTHVLGKGGTLNEDKSLENEADSLGKKAILGEPISQYQSPSLGIRNSLRTVQAKSNVIQRAIKTWGGEWDTDQYDLRKDKDPYGNIFPAARGVRGVDIKLKFRPNANVDAELIGLTQSVQSIIAGKPSYSDATRKSRSIKSKDAIGIGTGPGETDEGTAIDRLTSKNNPIYGSPDLGVGKTLEDTPADNNITKDPTLVGNPNLPGGANTIYQLGFRFGTGKALKTKDAQLYDGPTLSDSQKDSRQVFETTALALKGNQQGTYYGSVRWGWRTDSKENHSKIPLQVVSQAVPSSSFMKSAELWNSTKTSKGKETVDLPVVDVKVIKNNNVSVYSGPNDDILDIPPIAVISRGTRVRITSSEGVTVGIEVVDGPFTGTRGYINNIGVQYEDERP